MKWLYVLVEGQTEESFVKLVLYEHMLSRQVTTIPIIVETHRSASGIKHKGGGSWGKWARDLRRLTATHPKTETRFSTLFDLYGLPEDFPGLALAERLPSRTERATELEAAMGAAIGEWRLIPYIQVHEFEALVLAALPALRLLLEGPGRLGLDALEKEIAGLAPESVNDGPDTASSKRLLRLPTYSKTFHGPQAIAATGLAALRAACPRFSGWVDRLEACAL